MARPSKKGLDYFPLDINMPQDDDIFYLEAKYGLIGFGIYVRLLMQIYDNGYFYKWTEKETYIFSKKVNVDINTVSNVVNECINIGLFNENLYNEYSILTSKSIQRRYLEAVSRRKEVEFVGEYTLINQEDYDNLVIEYINSESKRVNVDINHNLNIDNVDTESTETPQSKVKESKVKKDINNICSDSKESDDNEEDNEPKFTEEDRAFKCACYLREKILKNNDKARVPKPTAKDMEDWAIEIDRLHRLGTVGGNKGYSWEEIAKIINWCQDDNFWKSNILSAGKLREKVITLENQMKRAKGGNHDGYKSSKNYKKSTSRKSEEQLVKKYTD